MKFEIPTYKERILLLGANGTGKSELAGKLLLAFPLWVAIDPKGDFYPKGSEARIIKSPTDWRWHGRLGHYGRPDRIIYRPSEEFDTKAAYNYVLAKILERAKREGKSEPFILHIDECLYLADVNATQYLKIIAVAGRSLNLGFWAASQRPKGIPVAVRTEAWRWEIFSLMYEEDEKEVEKYTKGKLTVEMLQNPNRQDYSWDEVRRSKGGRVLTVQHFAPLQIS
jgi:hypothetical protein